MLATVRVRSCGPLHGIRKAQIQEQIDIYFQRFVLNLYEYPAMSLWIVICAASRLAAAKVNRQYSSTLTLARSNKNEQRVVHPIKMDSQANSLVACCELRGWSAHLLCLEYPRDHPSFLHRVPLLGQVSRPSRTNG